MKRVLLVRLSAMGDVVQSLGAVRALADARPDCELHFVTQFENLPLFENLPYALQVHGHDRRGGLLGYLRTGRVLRRAGFDAALDLQGNWKSAGLVRLSRAPRRIGIAGAGRREPSSARFLNEPVLNADASHPALAAQAVVRVLAPRAGAAGPGLFARDAEVAAEADAVRALGMDPGVPFRVLVASAATDIRAWADHSREARASDRPVVWLCGPAESDVELPQNARVLRHPRGSLRRLVALGALCAVSGSDVIAPDRGAAHVLTAAGARCRVMYGPQDPSRTAPPAAEALVRRDGPDCVPCRSRRCTHGDGPICMDFTTDSASPPRT